MITVRDCLELEELRDAELVAGHSGLEHPVRIAHVIDEPDVALWTAPDVVVLTTGHNQPGTERFWREMIPALAGQRVAALFVALGRYIDAIPDEARAMADAHALPLITLPWSLPFVTVTQAIHRLIVEDNRDTWAKVSELQIRVTEAAIRAESVDHLLLTFSELLDRPVQLATRGTRSAPPAYGVTLGSPELRSWQLVIGPPALTSPEQIVARQMAGVLAVYLLQQKLARQTEFEIRSAMLDRVVQGQWRDDAIQRQRIRFLGFHADRPHQLLLLALPDVLRLDPDITQRYDEARDWLLQVIDTEDRLMSVTAQGLVLLVGGGMARQAPLTYRLAPFFERFPQTTGLVSGPLMLSEIPPIHQTMVKMLPLLQPGRLHSLHEALFPALIAELPEDLMRTFVDATWGRIRDPVLFDTLKSYVLSSGRRGEAANQLGVHRNTIANRIEQIEALLGRVLDGPFLTQLDLAYRWMLTRTG